MDRGIMDQELNMSVKSFIPFYKLPEHIEIECLFKLPFFHFEYDWFAEPLCMSATFLIGRNTENLYFAFMCTQKAFINENHQKNVYCEGLWKYDVAEFFISDLKSGQYQEFNISPAGSWWTMLFSEYRKEDHNNFKFPQQIEIFSHLSENSWQAALSIPTDQLSLDFSDLTKRTANVCAIVNGRDRKYLSWANINSDKPDFHKYSSFLPINLINNGAVFSNLMPKRVQI
jgi:hypothetical protein